MSDQQDRPTSSPLALGWSPRWEALAAAHVNERSVVARVLRHDGTAVLVAGAEGQAHVRLDPATASLAVGDWVVIDGPLEADAQHDPRISAVLDRSSLLQRRDPSTGDAQPIAANVDVVGIVCGLDRPVRIGRIQRFMSLAWDAGATPLVILSKADLSSDPGDVAAEIAAAEPFVDVVIVSAADDRGVHELLDRCAAKTLVLVGESGAGKSTLLNALAGQAVAVTGDVRGGDHKGRHTTTARQLHLLARDCCLIDTPGVREVGLATDVATIDAGFADIAELAHSCRFGDCQHETEPGCAVQAAVADGELTSERLDAWARLRREAAAAEVRADPAARHRADRQLNKIYRTAMAAKRPRG